MFSPPGAGLYLLSSLSLLKAFLSLMGFFPIGNGLIGMAWEAPGCALSWVWFNYSLFLASTVAISIDMIFSGINREFEHIPSLQFVLKSRTSFIMILSCLAHLMSIQIFPPAFRAAFRAMAPLNLLCRADSSDSRCVFFPAIVVASATVRQSLLRPLSCSNLHLFFFNLPSESLVFNFVKAICMYNCALVSLIGSARSRDILAFQFFCVKVFNSSISTNLSTHLSAVTLGLLAVLWVSLLGVNNFRMSWGGPACCPILGIGEVFLYSCTLPPALIISP